MLLIAFKAVRRIERPLDVLPLCFFANRPLSDTVLRRPVRKYWLVLNFLSLARNIRSDANSLTRTLIFTGDVEKRKIWHLRRSGFETKQLSNI